MLDEILDLLDRSSVIHNPQVIELIPYGKDAFRFKLRATVDDELLLQIWLNHNDRRTRYAYQLLRKAQPLLRWDNAPHHPGQTQNFPHHRHDEAGQVSASTLSGDPLTDLPLILAVIETFVYRLNT